MKTHEKLLCLLPLVLVSAAARGTELRYAPKAGTKIARTYTNPGEQSLSSRKFAIGGEEHAAADLEVVENSDEKIVLHDEIVEVAKGRPTKLKRAFGEMLQTRAETTTAGKTGEKRERNEERKSDLSDSTVVFTWDAEKEAYKAEFEGKGPDDDLLEGLAADVDLAGFLPEKSVSEGDEWKVDVAAFKSGVFQPGGEMAFHGKEPTSEVEKRFKRDLYDSIRGEIHATYKGTREVDGAKVGVIELKGEIAAEAERGTEREGSPEQGSTVGVKQEFEGELLWDLEKNMARSYKIDLTGKVSIATKLVFKKGEEEIEGELSMGFDIKESYVAAFEVE